MNGRFIIDLDLGAAVIMPGNTYQTTGPNPDYAAGALVGIFRKGAKQTCCLKARPWKFELWFKNNEPCDLLIVGFNCPFFLLPFCI